MGNGHKPLRGQGKRSPEIHEQQEPKSQPEARFDLGLVAIKTEKDAEPSQQKQPTSQPPIIPREQVLKEIEDAFIASVMGRESVTQVPELVVKERTALSKVLKDKVEGAYGFVESPSFMDGRIQYSLNRIAIGIGEGGGLFAVVSRGFSVGRYTKDGHGDEVFVKMASDERQLKSLKEALEQKGIANVYNEGDANGKTAGVLLFSAERNGQMWEIHDSLDVTGLQTMVNEGMEKYDRYGIATNFLVLQAASAALLKKTAARHQVLADNENAFTEETVAGGADLGFRQSDTIRLASMIPNDANALEKRGAIFLGIDGTEEKVSLLMAHSGKKVTVIDIKNAIKASGDSYEEAIGSLLQNEVNEGIVGPGMMYYKGTGGAVAFIETPKTTTEKMIRVVDNVLNVAMAVGLVVSVVASFGTTAEAAVPGVASVIGAEAAETGLIRGAWLALRGASKQLQEKAGSLVLMTVSRQTASQAERIASRALMSVWAAKIGAEADLEIRRGSRLGTYDFRSNALSAVVFGAFASIPSPLVMLAAVPGERIGGWYIERSRSEEEGPMPVTDRRFVERLTQNKKDNVKSGELLDDIDIKKIYAGILKPEQIKRTPTPASTTVVARDMRAEAVVSLMNETELDPVSDQEERLQPGTSASFIADLRKMIESFDMNASQFLKNHSVSLESEELMRSLIGDNEGMGVGDCLQKFVGSPKISPAELKGYIKKRVDGMEEQVEFTLSLRAMAISDLQEAGKLGEAADRFSLSESEFSWLYLTKGPEFPWSYGAEGSKERSMMCLRMIYGDGAKEAYERLGKEIADLNGQNVDETIALRAWNASRLQDFGSNLDGFEEGMDKNALRSKNVWQMLKYGVQVSGYGEEDAPRVLNFSGKIVSAYCTLPEMRIRTDGIDQRTSATQIDAIVANRAREVEKMRRSGELGRAAPNLGFNEEQAANLFLYLGGPADATGDIAAYMKGARERLANHLEQTNQKLTRLGLTRIDENELWNEYMLGGFSWESLEPRPKSALDDGRKVFY